MIREEDVYRIGRLGKTHGVRGEISFLFDDDVFDRADADYLVLEVDGILVPFFIEEYRFKSDSTAILKLEDVDTQERARQLTGTDVWFPKALVPDDEEGQLSLAFLVGFTIVDEATGKDIGRITAIDDSTANTLFELEDGRLIPATDDFVTHINTEQRKLRMQLPEGLLTL